MARKPAAARPASPTDQAAALSARFADEPFTARDAAEVLCPDARGPSANLIAGRALKKLADAGLVERGGGNTYLAPKSPPEEPEAAPSPRPAPAERERRQPAARQRTEEPGNAATDPPTPPAAYTTAQREQILRGNTPDGVGHRRRVARDKFEEPPDASQS